MTESKWIPFVWEGFPRPGTRRLGLHLGPSMCYMFMKWDEEYIVLHYRSFCAVQTETERHESSQRGYTTYFS